MRVYHGSDTVVDDPRIIKRNRPLDFGEGFYVTTSREQAENWAERVAFRNLSERRVINEYEFDIGRAENELVIIRFGSADKRWLEFICENRRGADAGEYDIAIGPVADDKVYRVVVEYENGDIDKESALKRLRAETLCDQILFHNEKALEYLKFIGARTGDNNE